MPSAKNQIIENTAAGALGADKVKIAVLGGDAREFPLIKELLKDYKVAAFARPGHLMPGGTIICDTVSEAFYGAAGIILPMPGIKNDGSLFCVGDIKVRLFEEDFSSLLPQTPVLVGAASDFLRRAAKKFSLRVLPMVETDEIAIPNSVPTAEGAISMAIANSPGVLAGSVSLILGYGRVGQALGDRLRCLGSRVIVANRGEPRSILAQSRGFEITPWLEWQSVCPRADYIFNTIPSPMLTAGVLEKLKNTALILDLAASPGGTDFAAAKELGKKAILASGLPGRFAPLTAGEILVRVYPKVLKECLDLNRRGEI